MATAVLAAPIANAPIANAPIADAPIANAPITNPNGDEVVRPFRWSAEAYMKASAAGLFEGRRVEMIDGEIIESNAHCKPHIVGCARAYARLFDLFPRSYVLTGQSTMYADESSRPEPDIAVFHGDWNDLLSDSPMTPVLICEVSIETLNYDRGRKASLYASLVVRDYWILNGRDHRLEVLRNPQPMPDQPHGLGYASTQILGPTQSLAPLELPDASVLVSDLLP